MCLYCVFYEKALFVGWVYGKHRNGNYLITFIPNFVLIYCMYKLV